MNNLSTEIESREEKAVLGDVKKSFFLNLFFVALLAVLYFVNQSYNFLDSLVSKLFGG